MTTIRRVLLASDTWHPEFNGVVRTLGTTLRELSRRGIETRLIEPGQFSSVSCPLYPALRLAWPGRHRLAALIDDFAPDAVHLLTEAGVGLGVRGYCLARGLRFTTSFHTRTPEYLQRMAGVPASWTYAYLRWFHDRAARVMVATASVEEALRRRGFRGPFARWSRGVDLGLFHPRPGRSIAAERPVLLYVGRVSVEKNLEAFLDLRTAGTKVVVGDGPARAHLERKYPAARFLGRLEGERLAETYAGADVFVFPSKTDTFGLVILEALASGVPVAAYPAPGPVDILTDERAGALDADLGRAVATALARGERQACLELARGYTWEHCTRQFVSNLVFAHPATPVPDLRSRARQAPAA
jgi:glycosyltransferase involved in cell wall biosynthesis